MAKGIDTHDVSLTKNGYQKLKDLIAKYPADKILANLDEIKLDATQALKMLAGNVNTNKVPDVWNEARKQPVDAQHALLLVSIIFSHAKLINLFKHATNGQMKGRIERAAIGDKEYTNLAYAMNELGVATNFMNGSTSVDYDLSPLVQKMNIGPLVKEIIANQLQRMGWKAPLSDDPFHRDFYEQSAVYGFNSVFGLTAVQYKDWLEGRTVAVTTSPLIRSDLKGFSKDLNDAIRDAGLKINEQLQIRFASSLLTKPFVILTGLAGSGKTKLAHAFASWICESESQILIVPVGADWTNREPLLGYPDALQPGHYIKPENGVLDLILKASQGENRSKPYFLILDEMNLSHVERYFADFLSSMESKGVIPLHADIEDWKDDVPMGIRLPPNLFIIGTVNIDETTYMFSPKVLDRANVIEFRVALNDMGGFLNNRAVMNLDKLRSLGAKYASSFVQRVKEEDTNVTVSEGLNETLLAFFKELKSAGAEFGYRTASEIYRFLNIISKLTDENGSPMEIEKIIDAAIVQKLLPKVHGSRRKLESLLKILAGLCLVNSSDASAVLNASDEPDYDDASKVKYPLSLAKIFRMNKRAIQDGFASFAEA